MLAGVENWHGLGDCPDHARPFLCLSEIQLDSNSAAPGLESLASYFATFILHPNLDSTHEGDGTRGNAPTGLPRLRSAQIAPIAILKSL